MRTTRILGMSLSIAMICGALSVGSAYARDTNLILRDPTGVLPVGTPVTAASSNLIEATAEGNLECEDSELSATLSNNDLAKVATVVTATHFFGDYLGIGGACKTSADGPALFEAEGLPWNEEPTAKGDLTLSGRKQVHGPTTKLEIVETFLALEGSHDKCTYEAGKIKSTFSVRILPDIPSR